VTALGQQQKPVTITNNVSIELESGLNDSGGSVCLTEVLELYSISFNVLNNY
jgi:hypothetical protein